LEQSYFNLPKAVESSFRILEFLSKKKNIRTQLNIDPLHVKYFEELYGDENRFEQILLNFLSNALKFTNPDGKVDVAIELN